MTDQAGKAEQFQALHIPGKPLILFNIWDAGSARAVTAAGAQALATGSWSVAHANGYDDGEALPLDAVLVCFHDDADRCDCRKPLPGLLLQAREAYGLDLTRSFMIGDRWRDIDAGLSAGCRTVFIDYQYDEPRPLERADFVCGSLKEAAPWILRQTHP